MFPSLTSFSGNGGAKFSKKKLKEELEPALAWLRWRSCGTRAPIGRGADDHGYHG